MSVISSLLLFLLCVSFHSCYARHLGAFGRKDPEQKSLLPFKNDETTSPGAGDGEGMRKQISSVDKDVDHKISSLKAKYKKGQERAMKTSSTGALKAESLLSHDVSWHLPRKKRGEEQPGFNLDYAPPKTHPGVHN